MPAEICFSLFRNFTTIAFNDSSFGGLNHT